MTFHIDDFDAPPGLDDDVPESCTLHRVIDSVCTDPNCPNNPAAQNATAQETRPFWQRAKTTPIYRTRPKTRCIL